jgi:hypothetical protein
MENVLGQMRKQFPDVRVHVFDVAGGSPASGRLVLTGRGVGDETVRSAMRSAFSGAVCRVCRSRTAASGVTPAAGTDVQRGHQSHGLYGEASFSSEMVSELMYGWPVEMLEETSNWVFVRQPTATWGGPTART